MTGVAELSERVGRVLRDFLAARRAEIGAIDPSLPALADELALVIGSGGKRVRPWLACWGYRAAGLALDDRMVTAASSLELVHTFALLQDDMMDASSTRRGRPTTHVTMGSDAALLISDLALVWADQLLCEAGFPAELLARAFTVLNALRSEVTLGQYLDLTGTPDEERALEVNRLKTAGYTVVRPIQLGMTLGGAGTALIEGVPAYGEPAGVAFQLRDDVLGAFGDEARTGKPSGDDLRHRKATWLWSRAVRLGGEPPRGGAAAQGEQVRQLRAWMRESGALAETEALIERLQGQALASLERLPVGDALRGELAQMTEELVSRSV
jgi:geranylgeranyl diphosphate synthase, type I